MAASEATKLELQPKQREVWDAVRAVPAGGLAMIGYGGAAGGGKSFAAALLACDLALADPGTSILLGRKTLADLKPTTMKEFDRVAAPFIVKSHGQDNYRDLRLPEWDEGVTSRVYFRGVEDFLSLGSWEVSAVILDEAGEIPEASALMLLSRLRHPAAYRFVFYAGSNPWPGWFENWFVNGELPKEVLEEFDATVTFIPSRIKDNQFLRPSPEAYEARLRAIYPAAWVERLVEGSFSVFEGQVYKGLTPAHQWIGDLPNFNKLCGGLDFGGANPDAHKTSGVVSGLVARGAQGVAENAMIRFAHFEDSSPTVHTDLFVWMRSVEAGMKRRVQWRADKSQSWGISLAKQAGFLIEPSHGGADSVMAGINLQNQRFEDGASFFTEGLTNPPSIGSRSWFDSMLRYRWAQQPNSDKAVQGVPVKRDDDTADADRYMHEEADGFPVYAGPAIPRRTATGRRRALSAV